jgi:hypothetical protein
MNNNVLLCFACAIVIGEDHPIASNSTRLLRGTCAICGRDTWCDSYNAEDVYKGKYERRKPNG